MVREVRERLARAEWLPQASAIALITLLVAAIWANTYLRVVRAQEAEQVIVQSHAIVLGEYGQRIGAAEHRIEALEGIQSDLRENNRLMREMLQNQKARR